MQRNWQMTGELWASFLHQSDVREMEGNKGVGEWQRKERKQEIKVEKLKKMIQMGIGWWGYKIEEKEVE